MIQSFASIDCSLRSRAGTQFLASVVRLFRQQPPEIRNGDSLRHDRCFFKPESKGRLDLIELGIEIASFSAFQIPVGQDGETVPGSSWLHPIGLDIRLAKEDAVAQPDTVAVIRNEPGENAHQ